MNEDGEKIDGTVAGFGLRISKLVPVDEGCPADLANLLDRLNESAESPPGAA